MVAESEGGQRASDSGSMIPPTHPLGLHLQCISGDE